MTCNMIQQIRDPVVRRAVQDAVDQACRERNIDPKPSDRVRKVIGDTTIRMPSGVPIKKVRIQIPGKTLIPLATDDQGRPIRAVKPGGNHHLEIYEKPDGSWTGRAVSTFEAHQRLRQGKPVVDRNPDNGWKFLMSLCINDMVLITVKGRRSLYRVQKMSVSSPVMVMRLHFAGRVDDNIPGVKATRHLVATWESFRKLEPEKVTVSLLGEIHPCND